MHYTFARAWNSQRTDPSVGVSDLGDLWTLIKGDERLVAHLWTHPDGWELQLTRGPQVLRVHVVNHPHQVTRYANRWRLNASSNGWRTPLPT